MNIEIIILIIQLAVIVASYLVGKYIVPKMSEDELKTFELVKGWVEQFVNEAANFVNYTGEEKKKYVTDQIVKILNEKGITMSEAQISALIETAYNTFTRAKEEKTTMEVFKQNLIAQSTSIVKGVD